MKSTIMTQKAQKWTQMDLWADGPFGVSGIEFYKPELGILIVETFINSFLFNEVNDRTGVLNYVPVSVSKTFACLKYGFASPDHRPRESKQLQIKQHRRWF